ncbi:unnamed protein product [Vicia faba]|uniref:Uncharacterized protein n=1 Tax=Vicia faba TaxID=3906 RepID=A0AAV0YGA3_VICFA|nr:unnamed protein product [Vicia faba]
MVIRSKHFGIRVSLSEWRLVASNARVWSEQQQDLRDRGRGRGRASQREGHHQETEFDAFPSIQQVIQPITDTTVIIHVILEPRELPKENIVAPVENSESLHNIDLKANMIEATIPAAVIPEASNSDAAKSDAANPAAAIPEASVPSLSEPAPTDSMHHEEIPGWSLSEVDKMAIDTMQLAQRMEEDDEDYDEEDE